MNHIFISFFITLGALLIHPPSCVAAEQKTLEVDSRELQLQDLLMVYLNQTINHDIQHYYSKYMVKNVSVYPYQVHFVKIERLNGFRGFDFKVVMDVSPVVGPHISVGEDRLTYEISFLTPEKAKLLKFEHLKTYPLPNQWRKAIKNPL
ncbi:DUF3888 domain-containing protein [Bacillus sp. DX4.1]|uniref:DUF3888 domain-containing protein n=1 Tax=Bacillus sp. DX4.1 TaxID=3055867 RepID=UPI0025A17B7F|nr:DUF3888 domain-containing protein [Bacillus sp. DX4.1]MDM5189248.1 DUF3888 domain-containing protein [Bacillus sp. DX4.1]